MAEDNRNLQADDLVRAAARLSSRGQKEEALSKLQEAVGLVPEHPTAMLHLAVLLAGAGRFDEASPLLRKALELRPESAAFHLFAGRACFDGADYAGAERELARTLEFNPGNDLAAAYRTMTRWAAGAAEAAGPGNSQPATPLLFWPACWR